MPRTHEDTWDLTSSVGATATMVAAARALASRAPRALINDPFAAPLVRAVGVEFITKMMDGELALDSIEGFSVARTQGIIDRMAVRTRYFDDYLAQAIDHGVRQVVILASGLDARAYRFPWPAGTVLYEIDQPQVIEFKTASLADIGAEPTADRRTVSIDLRENWPAALRQAGLDTTQPTAWLAEGLLMYLPAAAQDRLLSDITTLSSPGSSIGVEHAPGVADFDPAQVQGISKSFRDNAVDVDMASMLRSGQRRDVAEYLGTLGWKVEGVTRTELLRRHELPVPAPEDDDPLGELIFVSGRLAG
jgi:methyltransferase (TIGR00027 family)